MTAPLRNRPFSPQEWPVSGDHITSKTPGTLWERVADSVPELDRYLLALGIGRNSMHSARDTVRRLLGQSALERAKAAHPAGKGRKQATDE